MSAEIMKRHRAPGKPEVEVVIERRKRLQRGRGLAAVQQDCPQRPFAAATHQDLESLVEEGGFLDIGALLVPGVEFAAPHLDFVPSGIDPLDPLVPGPVGLGPGGPGQEIADLRQTRPQIRQEDRPAPVVAAQGLPGGVEEPDDGRGRRGEAHGHRRHHE